ncbi:MAG: T9SS type A sorting domain-containing protein [Fidelibacterota bacterium]
MSRKVLTIVGLLLTLSWSLTAAKVDIDSKIAKSNSHISAEYKGSPEGVLSIPDNLEYDVIVSGGTRRNAFVTGRGTADTMAYCPSSGGQFIYSPGEYDLVMYKMPADGIIKGVNPVVFEWADDSQQMEVSIWSVTYPMGSDGNPYPASSVDGDGWAGYWTDGTNDTVPLFVTDANATDYYGDVATELGPCGDTEPVPNAQDLVIERVWPASDFIHATFTPGTSPAQEANWIATADYGNEPEFTGGEWVGILIENQGPDGSDASGFYYCEGEGVVDPWVFAKFYNECNGTSGEGGWHIRHWVLDWPMAVELTSDRAPVIHDFERLATTLSTADRDVWAIITDDNPAGGDFGVAEANLIYRAWTPSGGMGDWTTVAMTEATDDTFKAVIPGQEAGSEVRYFIGASDVNGLNARTLGLTIYNIFKAVEANLFFYNSNTFASWIKGYYLYPVPDNFRTDFWGFGEGSVELFDNYDLVIEISGGGPTSCNDEYLATWLDEGNKDYITAGDEWLGACFYGWSGDVDIPAGDFPNDYLGLTHYYPDINYAASGDQRGISRLWAVTDDGISGDLLAYLADSLHLNYDPYYEIGVSNWLDGVDAATGSDVAFWAASGLIDEFDGTLADSTVDTLATGVYQTLTNGSRTVFFGFDVLSLNTSAVGDTVHGDGYHWTGISAIGALGGALNWMGKMSTDEDIAEVPRRFILRQNYPNPFNPVTTINFDLPNDGVVSLTVYNLLGQKVATLTNDFRRAGRHTVTWDGRNDLGQAVSTGVYLYRIDAGGDFSATKKMILLK